MNLHLKMRREKRNSSIDDKIIMLFYYLSYLKLNKDFNLCVFESTINYNKAYKSFGLFKYNQIKTWRGDCTLRMGSMYGRMSLGALDTRWPSILALCSLFRPTPLCSSSVRICKRFKIYQYQTVPQVWHCSILCIDNRCDKWIFDQNTDCMILLW